LGRYDEARDLIAEAATIAEGANASKNLTAFFHLTQARIALSKRRWPEAQTQSRHALELAGTQFKGLATEASYTLGLSQALSGQTREGRLKCDEANGIARETGNPSLQSEALLALAEVMQLSGDYRGALTTSLQAQEILARLGKQNSEWLAFLIAARASQRAGDQQKAREYAVRAQALLTGHQQRWGENNYQTYLSRPDIQISRQQLNELLVHPNPQITSKGANSHVRREH
jgi:ATP/maltotriose-dependent transcriptional regulator MalT